MMKDILLSLLILLLVSLCIFLIGRTYPKNKINENSFLFKTYSFEKNGMLYEKIKIKKWKTKLPDASVFITKYFPNFMVKKRINNNNLSIYKSLIKETCIAEATHLWGIIVSTILIFIIKIKTFKFFSILYSVCNIPFILIQRYNRPRLKRLINSM